jgi:hypothetical protein
MCATVVIAAVSPLARDVSHSANTLKYAAPLRVAAQRGGSGGLERDPRDPALWTHAQACDWLTAAASDPLVGSPTEMRSLPSSVQQQQASQY